MTYDRDLMTECDKCHRMMSSQAYRKWGMCHDCCGLEATRLAAELSVDRKYASEKIDDLESSNAAAEGVIDALRTALERYGKHESKCEISKWPGGVVPVHDHVCGMSGYNPMIDPPCPACGDRQEHRTAECTCGLAAALAEPPAGDRPCGDPSSTRSH